MNTNTRSDSYLGSLTEEQRDDVCSLLLQQPRLSLREVRDKAPTWSKGPRDGEKPSERTLGEIRSDLLLERSLHDIEATAKFMEATKAKLKGVAISNADNEALLDQVLTLVSQEAIQRTLERDDPKARTAGVRLLLKRADQKRFDRRMSFLEQQVEKTKKVLKDESLTPEQQRQRVKQIFGM